MTPDDTKDGPPILRTVLMLLCCLGLILLTGVLAYCTSKSKSHGPPSAASAADVKPAAGSPSIP
jgi:hypothetical protein